MRTITLLSILLLTSILTLAQAPQLISYQGVVRNGSGEIVANQTVSLRLSVLSGTPTGPSVYTETHDGISTNQFGLYNVHLGGGTIVNGSFATIDWGNGAYYLQTELDLNGGTAFSDLIGQAQLVSVPYALFAGSVAEEEELVPTVQVFTSSGTWTKPNKLKYVVVEIVGGGGAGSAWGDGSGGGGASGYARKLIPASSLSSTETVTVGTGGIGVAFNDGGNGTNSSFGAILAANGGIAAIELDGGQGGASSGGDLNIQGQHGGDGAAVGNPNVGGMGGNSELGFGGAPRYRAENLAGSIDGYDATGHGAGGGGAARGSNGSSTGGDGGNGIVIVTEYY